MCENFVKYFDRLTLKCLFNFMQFFLILKLISYHSK